MNKYLYNKKFITSEFHRHMNTPGKGCFHITAQERFMKLFALKDTPDFFMMQNKVSVYWYKLLVDKYSESVEELDCGLSKSSIYVFYHNFEYNKRVVVDVYKEMLEYYNNFLVPLINSINPTQYKNFTFKTLPDNSDKLFI